MFGTDFPDTRLFVSYINFIVISSTVILYALCSFMYVTVLHYPRWRPVYAIVATYATSLQLQRLNATASVTCMALSNPPFFMPTNFPCASPPADPSPESNDPADDPDPDPDESRSRLLEDELVQVPPDDDATEASPALLDDIFSDASWERITMAAGCFSQWEHPAFSQCII